MSDIWLSPSNITNSQGGLAPRSGFQRRRGDSVQVQAPSWPQAAARPGLGLRVGRSPRHLPWGPGGRAQARAIPGVKGGSKLSPGRGHSWGAREGSARGRGWAWENQPDSRSRPGKQGERPHPCAVQTRHGDEGPGTSFHGKHPPAREATCSRIPVRRLRPPRGRGTGVPCVRPAVPTAGRALRGGPGWAPSPPRATPRAPSLCSQEPLLLLKQAHLWT